MISDFSPTRPTPRPTLLYSLPFLISSVHSLNTAVNGALQLLLEFFNSVDIHAGGIIRRGIDVRGGNFSPKYGTLYRGAIRNSIRRACSPLSFLTKRSAKGLISQIIRRLSETSASNARNSPFVSLSVRFFLYFPPSDLKPFPLERIPRKVTGTFLLGHADIT